MKPKEIGLQLTTGRKTKGEEMVFKIGDTAYHKASRKHLVIIKIFDEHNLEVRDEDMKKYECIPEELQSQQEHDAIEARKMAEIQRINEQNAREIEERYGF